jgi:hypothetical protein
MKPYELSEWNDMDEIPSNPTLISVCCGARPWGEVYDAPNCHPTGICSKCKDHTTFEQEIDNE